MPAKRARKEKGVRTMSMDFFEEVRRVLNLPKTANATDVFIEIGRLKGKANEAQPATVTTTFPGVTFSNDNIW